LALASALLFDVLPVRAHEGPHGPAQAGSPSGSLDALANTTANFTLDPFVIAGLCGLATLYGLGMFRLTQRAGVLRASFRRESIAFALSWLTLFIALVSPLDAVSDVLFSAHMLQHELLMLVAAPLLVYAQPLRTYVWALSPRLREPTLRVAKSPAVDRTFHFLTGPLTALVVHGVVRWLWHVPSLFEAALANEWLHGLQHATFFVSAMLFWWALVHGRYGRLGYGVSVLFVFATSMHTGALGALIALARGPLYPTHAQRFAALRGDALADQQLAGLVMWVGAGLLFMVLGLSLFLAWLGEAERRAGRSALTAAMREAHREELTHEA
jgi:putative membrane protein